MNDCSGPGGLTSGTCSPIWNALGLDNALHSIPFSTDTYGKYATAALTSAELAALGIGTGANSVLLSTFANNIHWDGVPFSSASVPINIVVTPPSSVPEPSSLGLFGLGLLLLAAVSVVLRRRPHRAEGLAAA